MRSVAHISLCGRLSFYPAMMTFLLCHFFFLVASFYLDFLLQRILIHTKSRETSTVNLHVPITWLQQLLTQVIIFIHIPVHFPSPCIILKKILYIISLNLYIFHHHMSFFNEILGTADLKKCPIGQNKKAGAHAEGLRHHGVSFSCSLGEETLLKGQVTWPRSRDRSHLGSE